MLFRQEGEDNKIGKSHCRGSREIKEMDLNPHQKEEFKGLFAISKISFMGFDYQRNAEPLNHRSLLRALTGCWSSNLPLRAGWLVLTYWESMMAAVGSASLPTACVTWWNAWWINPADSRLQWQPFGYDVSNMWGNASTNASRYTQFGPFLVNLCTARSKPIVSLVLMMTIIHLLSVANQSATKTALRRCSNDRPSYFGRM